MAKSLNPQPDCLDFELLPATPLVPNAGSVRLYADAASGDLAAIKADGTSALPGANPAGALGDVQFNDGTGGLADADTIAAGSVVNMDSSGDLTISPTGFLSINAPASGGELNVQGSLQIEATVGNINLISTNGQANWQSGAITLIAEGGGGVTLDSTSIPSNIFIQAGTAQITIDATHVNLPSLQVFANNAAALAGGLIAGDLYRNGANPDLVCVVH